MFYGIMKLEKHGKNLPAPVLIHFNLEKEIRGRYTIRAHRNTTSPYDPFGGKGGIRTHGALPHH